ncbi:hypothetical protein GBAR_LOCUS13483, partial [Geodia barretti]
MSEKEERGDVFFRGVLLYKPGALATCQKCRAELKFESKSGFKRLELYHIHGNRRMPGSPWMTIPLTNALGVTSGKQHTITRAKYTFMKVPALPYTNSATTHATISHLPCSDCHYEYMSTLPRAVQKLGFPLISNRRVEWRCHLAMKSTRLLITRSLLWL